MSDLKEVIADLTTEGEQIDLMAVAGLDEAGWRTETPATGWTVAHQIAHLIFIFRLAGTAASDAETFKKMAAAAAGDFDAAVAEGLKPFVVLPPDQLLARWQTERAAAIGALAVVPPDQLVPWLVRPLPPSVLAAAGYMEAYAHSQDIADALGVKREPTDRIRHLAWFATLTRDFGYQAHGLTPPEEPFRYELTAPSGAIWEYGPADATQRITGPALDFCLVATRRRHRDDTALKAEGAEADRWLDIAQAYRGPAGKGRTPGQFPNN